MFSTLVDTDTPMKEVKKRQLVIMCSLCGLLLLGMNEYLVEKSFSTRYLTLSSKNCNSSQQSSKRATANRFEKPPDNTSTKSSVMRSNASSLISPRLIDRQRPINLDLVVALSGEFGNHILKIAYGRIIQLMALEDGRFNFTLRYLSQGIPKSDKTRAEVHQCFTKHFSPDIVNLAEWKANSKEWNDIWKNNQVNFVSQFYSDWDDPSLAGKRLKFSNMTTFDHLADVTRRMEMQGHQVDAKSHSLRSLSSESSSPSTPFLLVESFAPLALIDKYYNELRELFSFNETNCCSTRPGKDETVLHLRGFSVEIPRMSKERIDFQELDPDRTANELLRHLDRGSKVAIVSRFGRDVMQPYLNAMRKRGIRARAITGQTGVQGFCFLKSTTKELVGTYKSTYIKTAAMLSDTVRNVTLYSLSKSAVSWPTKMRPFTSERLKRKHFHYPKFQCRRRVSGAIQ